MLIRNQVEVAATPEKVWAHLLDMPRVAPCFPRCRMTETIDERTWKGEVGVNLGPISYTFPGVLKMEERDDERHRVILAGSGADLRGKGTATIRIHSWLEPRPVSTLVKVEVDLTLIGAVAQYGQGMLEDGSARLVQIFADHFKANMAAEMAAAPGKVPPEWSAAGDVSGIRLAFWAFYRALGRAIARLFGRGKETAAEPSR